jgi:hypothetical protein
VDRYIHIDVEAVKVATELIPRLPRVNAARSNRRNALDVSTPEFPGNLNFSARTRVAIAPL